MRFGFTAPLERRTGCDVSTTYQSPNIPGGIGDMGASSSPGSVESPTTIFYIRRTSENALRNVPAVKLTLRAYVP